MTNLPLDPMPFRIWTDRYDVNMGNFLALAGFSMDFNPRAGYSQDPDEYTH